MARRYCVGCSCVLVNNYRLSGGEKRNKGLALLQYYHTDTDREVFTSDFKWMRGDCVCVGFFFFFFSCPLPPSSSVSSSSSLCGGAVVHIEQLSDQSLSKLRSAVAFDCVGVGHLVEDVRVVDGNADAQPEHLLPCLVGLVEDKVPAAEKRAAQSQDFQSQLKKCISTLLSTLIFKSCGSTLWNTCLFICVTVQCCCLMGELSDNHSIN